jgi:aspartate kinase
MKIKMLINGHRHLLIHKFCGLSLTDHEKTRSAAHQVASAYRRGARVVVVVAAHWRTTDELIALAKQVHPDPPARELDMLLATAGQASSALMVIALHALGVPAVSFTGAQAGILTDSAHTRARICGFSGARVQQALDARQVVVVAGGQGADNRGEITTLGREGANTTVGALIGGLGASTHAIMDI